MNRGTNIIYSSVTASDKHNNANIPYMIMSYIGETSKTELKKQLKFETKIPAYNIDKVKYIYAL